MSTTSTKRLSLNVAVGPRALHLVEGEQFIDRPYWNSGPRTAPLYNSNAHAGPSTPRTASPNPHIVPVRRQSSISYKPANRDDPPRSTHTPGVRGGPSRPNSVPATPDVRSPPVVPERSPVTLVEKHAELLHFIAQKESKCLELRSQLAQHEGELLQLKRKWERIVNRGFDKANSTAETSANGLISPGSGAVLEGIKEGMQGVSRFIAAGLTVQPPPQSTSPIPPHITLAAAPRRGHSTTQSNSSVSTTTTTTTTSTRFSQSSASSIGEEDMPRSASSDELMMKDTGAMMSPNPAFLVQKERREARSRSRESATSKLGPASSKEDYFDGPKRSASPDAPSPQLSRRRSNDTKPTTPADTPPPVDSKKAKRASIHGALDSLAAASAPAIPVSGWVGTVGRRLGELQKTSAFTNSQKRASILFSDVSSLVNSLAAPPPNLKKPLTSPQPIPSQLRKSSSISKPVSSLLDDDDDGAQLGMGALKPDKPSPAPSTPPLSDKPVDDEEEWNW